MKFRLSNPIKKMTSQMVDNIVLYKIMEAREQVELNFKRWYRSTLISALIILLIVAVGIASYFITDQNHILKLLVAVAYLLSMGIFLKRRGDNIQFLTENWSWIKKYTKIILISNKMAEKGMKIRTIIYNIYTVLYHEKVTHMQKRVHHVFSFFRFVPNKDEAFEIIYPRMTAFFREAVFLQLIRYFVFVILFTAISLFVKNAVVLEMKFNSIFGTLFYPFEYFLNLISRY